MPASWHRPHHSPRKAALIAGARTGCVAPGPDRPSFAAQSGAHCGVACARGFAPIALPSFAAQSGAHCGLHADDFAHGRKRPSFAAQSGAHCGDMAEAQRLSGFSIIRRVKRRSLRGTPQNLRPHPLRPIIRRAKRRSLRVSVERRSVAVDSGHHSPRKAAFIAGRFTATTRLWSWTIIRRAKRRSLRAGKRIHLRSRLHPSFAA